MPEGIETSGFRMVPPVYFLLTILVMAALQWLAPLATVIPAPVSYTGAVIILGGLSIVIVAARLFQIHETAIVPFEESSALVVNGIYRFTRNPMYLGMVIVLTGIATLLGTLTPFLPIPVFAILIQRLFIVKEEAILTETFGEQYREYRQSVRRWI